MSSKAYNESSSADYAPSNPSKRGGMLELFPPRAEPQSGLAEYRLLSPTAAIRVSPLAIGAMSIGDQWLGFMGGQGTNQKQAEEFLDTYYEAGGNFIDTANNYQDEQSEHIIGEWMEKRGIRNEIVLATKYTTYTKNRESGPFKGIGINYAGNHKKSLRLSLDESLKRLRTDYIDVLYVHWWDHSTSIPELMQSLNEVVKSGKVLYLGISDTPAWIVSQANEYARQNAMAQFVVYQGLWNLGTREIERDVLPMCRNNGMGLAPWGVLGQGKFKTEDELKSRAQLRGGGQPSEEQLALCKVLEQVASEIGQDIHLAHVAMAWCRQKFTNCFPIIGGTSIDNLKSNIEALKIHLTPEQVQKLDEASPFQPGFPTGFFGTDPRELPGQTPVVPLMKTAGKIVFNKHPE